MKLTPWRKEDPSPPAQSLATWIQRFFDEPWARAGFGTLLPEAFQSPGVPAMNVAEDDKTLTVSVELPGLRLEDIRVDLTGNLLTIQAERRLEDDKKNGHFHRVERHYGSLSRSLTLPDGLDREAIDAVYKDGLLTLRIPKVEPTPTAKVKIKGG